MEEQKELFPYISCSICKQKFHKDNKPLIMFCGHNICENCKSENSKKIICSCGKMFSKREAKKFPINYAILEIKQISEEENVKMEPKPSPKNDDITNIIIDKAFQIIEKKEI